MTKWHVREGDRVQSGDVIAEIETDKATMEVEAVDEGTIGKLLIAEGTEHVPVNRPIALLVDDEEDDRSAEPIAPAFFSERERAPSTRRCAPLQTDWRCGLDRQRGHDSDCRADHAERQGSSFRLAARPQARQRTRPRSRRAARLRPPRPHHQARRRTGRIRATSSRARRTRRSRRRGRHVSPSPGKSPSGAASFPPCRADPQPGYPTTRFWRCMSPAPTN